MTVYKGGIWSKSKSILYFLLFNGECINKASIKTVLKNTQIVVDKLGHTYFRCCIACKMLPVILWLMYVNFVTYYVVENLIVIVKHCLFIFHRYLHVEV